MRAPLPVARIAPRGLVLVVSCVCAWVFVAQPGCAPLREGEPFDPNNPTDPNMPTDPVLRENGAGCRGVPCAADNPCAGGRRCVDSICFPEAGSCMDDNGCSNDNRCYQGSCIPWDACKKLTPYDPECKGQIFTPEEFKAPQVACSLTGYQSLSIPVVADLDGDKKPEVITVAYPNTIVAMRGDTCALMWKIDREPLLSSGQGSVAVADLDADGSPEIVTLDGSSRVIVFDKSGNLLARGATPTQEQNTTGQNWSAPSIAEIDGVAPPEIIAGAQVSRFVKAPTPRVDVLWTKPNRTAFWGSISIAADLDGDGTQEVITSDKIYDGITGADKTPPALSQKPFYPQVGDFNMDKKADLVLVQSDRGSQVVSIYDYANKKTIFGPYTVAGGGWGGPAVVADFDGDKVPDFGLASATNYYTYAMKCATTPKPADCKGTDPGVLWQKRTTDASSGGTGSSVFDFNGDGTAEVVYRDECFLRVYNGRDGKTLFAHNITSNTCLELPVIADVNNDGHADIVVTSDSLGACSNRSAEAETGAPFTGLTNGLFVLRDPMNRWMPSRPLWNQHAYHITNINDDLTVPAPEPDNWLTYNNYRQNVQGGAMGSGNLPDPTGRQGPSLDTTDCSKLWRLHGEVCNRGVGPTAVPMQSTFYDAHPDMGGKVICTATLNTQLMPGKCAPIQCDWNNPQSGPRDIYLRVGDDGKGGRAGGQCKSGNDLSVLKGASCSSIPG